ncbi:hypothetical protein CDAR_468411, partial [Caerostris darwini]
MDGSGVNVKKQGIRKKERKVIKKKKGKISRGNRKLAIVCRELWNKFFNFTQEWLFSCGHQQIRGQRTLSLPPPSGAGVIATLRTGCNNGVEALMATANPFKTQSTTIVYCDGRLCHYYKTQNKVQHWKGAKHVSSEREAV